MFIIKRHTGFLAMVFIVASALVLAATAAPNGQRLCKGKHTVFMSEGPAVEATCEDRNPSASTDMPGRPGCYCLPGYVRNYEQHCMPVSRCDNPNLPFYPSSAADCRLGQIYQSCVGAIESVCKTPNSPVSCCLPKCVPYPTSAADCPPGQIYQSCQGAIDGLCREHPSPIGCCLPKCVPYPTSQADCRRDEVYRSCQGAIDGLCKEHPSPIGCCLPKCVPRK